MTKKLLLLACALFFANAHAMINVDVELVYSFDIFSTTPHSLNENDKLFIERILNPTCATSKMSARYETNNNIKIYDIETKECLHTIHSLTSKPLLNFSPNGKKLAVTTNYAYGAIDIWDTRYWLYFDSFTCMDSFFLSVAFSPDSKYIAGGTREGLIEYWNLETNDCTNIFAHKSKVLCISFIPNSPTIASGSEDQAIAISNYNNPLGLLKLLKGHTGSVNTIDCDQKGTLLISGSDDKTVKLWDIQTGKCIATLTDHTSPVKTVAFNQKNNSFASRSEDGMVNVYTYKIVEKTDPYILLAEVYSGC